MARSVDNEHWAGRVDLSPWSFTKDANRLIISQSGHTFRIENKTTKKVGMRADYHHVILKKDSNGLYTIPVKNLSYEGAITVPRKEVGEEYGLWTHVLQQEKDETNWRWFKTWDFTGEEGASYKLDTYVAVRHGQGAQWGDDLQHDRWDTLNL